MPNSARNVRVIAPLAAENRRVLEEAHVEHRVRAVQLPQHEPDQHDHADRERTDTAGDVQPWLGRFDDRPQQRGEPDDRQHGAERVERGADGSRESGMNRKPSTSAATHDRHVHEEHRAPPEVLEQKPPVMGPRPMPSADTPAHTPMALARSLRVGEDVGEDRERRRHDERAADAHERTACRSASWPTARTPRAPSRRRRSRGRWRGRGSDRTGHRGCPRSAGGRRRRSCRRRRSTGAGWRTRPGRRAPGLACARSGSATLRIVLSSPITIRLRHRTSSVSHRRS